MKKIVFEVMFFSLIVSIYSCSTSAFVEKEPNSNLSDYKSYMWVNTMASENDASARATAFADLSVHNAVNAELQRWGWRESNEKPDVFVSYDILVEKNVETQSDPVYTQPYSRLYYNRFKNRWSAISYPSQFLGYQQYQVPVKEVTITITMTNSDSDKKIWQGWTTERLGSSALSDLNLKKSIRNIFKKSEHASVAGKY